MIDIREGDCREVLRAIAADSIDSCATDPPYHLTSIGKAGASRGFMGKTWDGGGVAFEPETWAEVYRVLKPGAHLLAFGGTRTYHRMACAIEDAGFEIRDQIGWAYGTGFPKSHDVSKGLDALAGAKREVVGRNPNHRAVSGVGYEGIYAGGNTGSAVITAPTTNSAREWQGWGTALKPAWEPICLARKPLIGTVAANVLAHGTGAINVDGCRVPAGNKAGGNNSNMSVVGMPDDVEGRTVAGRWPANLIHDGSDEVLACFPDVGGGFGVSGGDPDGHGIYGKGFPRGDRSIVGYDDSGSAARFFYCAKASSKERAGSKHPTVKPVALMRYLVRLVTPPGGTVLDPFAGSGTTGVAAHEEGFSAVLCEREAEYVADIRRRCARTEMGDFSVFY